MSEAVAQRTDGAIRSLVPARMDRLPWTKFHWSVVFGLGVSWILDGLEIQIVSESGFQKSLGMSAAQVGLTGTVYLVGQVVGALTFGRLTDRLGRRKLFIMTLVIYLVGSGLAGLSPNMIFLWVFRFIAGLGIGGEYTAINSAIDELIPAHFRGRVDIAVNGTYWAGAFLGAPRRPSARSTRSRSACVVRAARSPRSTRARRSTSSPRTRWARRCSGTSSSTATAGARC